jgi:MFS family permease
VFKTVLGTLRNRNFLLLWLGSMGAFVGFFTSNVVQAVVAFDLTQKNQAAGFVVFGRGLAQLLLAPIGGALADRISKRAILISSQSFTAAVFFGLAWLMASGEMQVVHLSVGSFLVGMTFAFLGPTRSAYVVELVEPEHRGSAIALNQVALNFSRVAGPALAGVLLGWKLCGPTGAFIAMGLCYASAVATQYLLPRSQTSGASSQHGVLSDIADGVRYVRGNPRLRALLLMFVLAIMLGFPYVTLLPGFVKHQLNLPSTNVSLLFSVSAAGGLLASLLSAPIADSRYALLAYRGAGVAFGVSLMLLLGAHSLLAASSLLFVVGFASGAFTTLNGAVLMRNTDARYMGRVMSIAMLAFGAFGLVGLPVGVLADAVGEGPAFVVLGGLVTAAVLFQGIALARTTGAEAAPAAH